MSVADGVASVGQRVTSRMADGLSQVRAAREVSALVGRIAPGSARVPVPGPALQFGILTIGDRPPSGGKRFLEDCGRLNLVHEALGQNVNRCAHSYIVIERLDHV